MSSIANPDLDTPFEMPWKQQKATIEQIHKAGINKIVLLSHLGYEADLESCKCLCIGGSLAVIATACKVISRDMVTR